MFAILNLCHLDLLKKSIIYWSCQKLIYLLFAGPVPHLRVWPSVMKWSRHGTILSQSPHSVVSCLSLVPPGTPRCMISVTEKTVVLTCATSLCLLHSCHFGIFLCLKVLIFLNKFMPYYSGPCNEDLTVSVKSLYNYNHQTTASSITRR